MGGLGGGGVAVVKRYKSVFLKTRNPKTYPKFLITLNLVPFLVLRLTAISQ